MLMNYRMSPCGGVKTCPVTNYKYTAAIREYHKCPVHGEPLQKHTQCPVHFVYLQPGDVSDKRRGKVHYQIKKVQGPKVDAVTAVYDFEQYADENDQVDELASGGLAGASMRDYR